MTKRLLLLLSCLMSLMLCHAQTSTDSSSDEGRDTPLQLSLAPAAGFEVDFARPCTNVALPIELRLLPASHRFNFAIGERIALHRGHADADPVADQRYYSWLMEPYINYDQISTYLAARWNIITCGGDDKVGLAVAAAYLFNVNTNGKVYLDAPRQGPWPPYPTQSVYEWMDGYGLRPYTAQELLNHYSHSLRLDMVIGTPGFEFSVYAMLPLTSAVNLETASTEMYYDRTYANSELSTNPVTLQDGISPYLPVTLLAEGRHLYLYNDIMQRYTIGFSLKLYAGTGYFRSLFKK